MSQYSAECHVMNGRLELENLPFPNNANVRVFVFSKVDLSKMSFNRLRLLTKSVKGNLSDDIDKERDER